MVPEGCALRVGDEIRPWREGECLVFDTAEHEAWTRSDRMRTVLLRDILRPSVDAYDDIAPGEVESIVGRATGRS